MGNGRTSIGNQWLKEHYGLHQYHLTHRSYLGSRLKEEIESTGNVVATYPPSYNIEESAVDHIEFALKYDDLNLDFLKVVFEKISQDELLQYISARPKGIYQRKMGYLYELLIRAKLPLPDTGKINYADLQDAKRFATGKNLKIPRWGINDNLLGTMEYCPIIRRTPALEEALSLDFKKLIDDVTEQFPAEIFHRAANYLYTRETRSSYQIEKEEPSPDRMDRFIRILEKAGENSRDALLSEENLTILQNQIVDPRFAVKGYREDQNYIGQTTSTYKQIYHYICPPPEAIRSMMKGLTSMALKAESEHPIIQAAAVAFGFVFIHPFEDGNGRIHRFLIHDFLIRNKLVQKGMIIPVSAHMLNHIKDYDETLEKYSKPLMGRVKFKEHEDQTIDILNPKEVEGYFRFPDLTEQTIYLAHTIKSTIVEDIYNEMDFLVKYDEVKSAIQKIADLPDRKLDLIIKFLHQNNGRFPKRRRNDFEKITDEEIARMEKEFQAIFERE